MPSACATGEEEEEEEAKDRGETKARADKMGSTCIRIPCNSPGLEIQRGAPTGQNYLLKRDVLVNHFY